MSPPTNHGIVDTYTRNFETILCSYVDAKVLNEKTTRNRTVAIELVGYVRELIINSFEAGSDDVKSRFRELMAVSGEHHEHNQYLDSNDRCKCSSNYE